MKTLIATAIIALVSSSAHAWQPRFDAQQFYEGQKTSNLRIAAEPSDSALYTEGNIDTGASAPTQGHRIGHIDQGNDNNLYQEGNYEV
ncbi:hypothetical protein [endosymbiont of unidentified scaly snail isolate Monju]|uniref:hypothetical protein n=1 Tax=endosymbiont of unidentified scaly snail isolate Monju TaxID=1248727 RepID=UPI0005BD7396|nr:hypothetical protein [endosymbiont of unidentified scaly snail isolate Monju]